jgi:UrcA family protein
MMFRMMIGAVALTLPPAVSANSSDVIVQASPTAHVVYGDLNLDTKLGRTKLTGRIRLAANALCIENNIEPLDVKLAQTNCYRMAVASGVGQMDAIAGR